MGLSRDPEIRVTPYLNTLQPADSFKGDGRALDETIIAAACPTWPECLVRIACLGNLRRA